MILMNWNAYVQNDKDACAAGLEKYALNWPEVDLTSLRPHKLMEFLTFIRMSCDVRNKHSSHLIESVIKKPIPMMQTYIETGPENWLEPSALRKTYLMYTKPYYTGKFEIPPEEYSEVAEERPASPRDVIRCYIHRFIYNPKNMIVTTPHWDFK